MEMDDRGIYVTTSVGVVETNGMYFCHDMCEGNPIYIWANAVWFQVTSDKT